MKRFEHINCSICGSPLVIFDDDVDNSNQILHGVCPICYEPTEFENPFYQEWLWKNCSQQS